MKQVPKNKKTITDTLGYAINLERLASKLKITTSGAQQGICLSKFDVEIFKAFLDRAIMLPSNEPSEEPLSGSVLLSFHDRKPPFVRLKDGPSVVDIHPASWLPLSLELALFAPWLTVEAA